MGILDWLGPLALTKRSGWSDLPAPTAVATKQSPSWAILDQRAVMTVNTLVHGPGASDLAYGRRGDGNSAVVACLLAISTAYVEAPLVVYRQTSPTDREPLWDSPLQMFLRRPNPALSMRKLLWWAQWAKHVDGNAYFRKIRSGDPTSGNVVQLWPISPTRIIPVTERGSTDFITAYRYYQSAGNSEDIPPENIIHLRLGIDDADHRLGCSPLKRLIREISSDDQATRYADRLLSNFAINGLSLEFDSTTDPLTQAEAEAVKARVQAAYSGDNVGAVSVLSPGAKLVSHGFSPEQMDLEVLHNVPETRIAAVLRVPAIVAGLNVGLKHTIYNNFSQAREQFSEDTILPLYADDDDEFTAQLVPDFTSDTSIVIAHDISAMRSLQDDVNKRAERHKLYVEAGVLDVDEVRAELGREPRVDAPGVPQSEVTPEVRHRPSLVRVGRAPLAFTKALDDLPAAFDNFKDGVEPDWVAALEAFQKSQVRRVNARLRGGIDDAEGLVPESEATLLGDKLEPLQLEALTGVQRLVVAELGIAFDLDDEVTREYLTSAGSNIKGITDTTRAAVQAALVEGQAAGEGIDQLARRLRNLPAFGDARARVVARTELGHASNIAAITSYEASGVVVGIRVFDGDYDPPCQAMNGRTFPLGKQPPTLEHPNCVRAFAPIVDADEIEQSA